MLHGVRIGQRNDHAGQDLAGFKNGPAGAGDEFRHVQDPLRVTGQERYLRPKGVQGGEGIPGRGCRAEVPAQGGLVAHQGRPQQAHGLMQQGQAGGDGPGFQQVGQGRGRADLQEAVLCFQAAQCGDAFKTADLSADFPALRRTR